MSSDEVVEKFKETLRSAKELLVTVKKTANAELSKTAPKLVHSLDKSFEEATGALSDTLVIIDKEAKREKLQLLNTYKSFLKRQEELIDKRIKSAEGQS